MFVQVMAKNVGSILKIQLIC